VRVDDDDDDDDDYDDDDDDLYIYPDGTTLSCEMSVNFY
jgi:hypothetical protein